MCLLHPVVKIRTLAWLCHATFWGLTPCHLRAFHVTGATAAGLAISGRCGLRRVSGVTQATSSWKAFLALSCRLSCSPSSCCHRSSTLTLPLDHPLVAAAAGLQEQHYDVPQNLIMSVQAYEAVLASGQSATLPPLAVPQSPVSVPADATPAEVHPDSSITCKYPVCWSACCSRSFEAAHTPHITATSEPGGT